MTAKHSKYMRHNLESYYYGKKALPTVSIDKNEWSIIKEIFASTHTTSATTIAVQRVKSH